jgi:7-keto-8-aminopelargonate synthetase-like enzyme/DNA-binding XRE family transcriptional regulator
MTAKIAQFSRGKKIPFGEWSDSIDREFPEIIEHDEISKAATEFSLCVRHSLRDQRKKIGQNQADVAKAMGVTQPYISKIEGNSCIDVGLTTIYRFAHALHLEPRFGYVKDGFIEHDFANDREIRCVSDTRFYRHVEACYENAPAILTKFGSTLKGAERQAELRKGEDCIYIERILAPTRAIVGGKETILACGGNYLGMNYDSQCIESGIKALQYFGAGPNGSRITKGYYALHKMLEHDLAEFLNKDHVLLFPTGYMASMATISSLCGEGDIVFLDQESHASSYDGCKLSLAETRIFKHNDPDSLRRKLERCEKEGLSDRPKLVVLEAIYNGAGDKVKLKEFVSLRDQYEFSILLNESHAFGVLGSSGRGLAEEAGVEDKVDFIVGSFAKAFGAVGGFAAAAHPMFEMLRFASRQYLFTTPLSPSAVAMIAEALKQVREVPKIRQTMKRNSKKLHRRLQDVNVKILSEPGGPLVTVLLPDEIEATGAWLKLLENGVYVDLCCPPDSPFRTKMLRCSVSAAHSSDDIKKIGRAFMVVFGERTDGNSLSQSRGMRNYA